MGCGSSVDKSGFSLRQKRSLSKNEKAWRAAALIQSWYRRYKARIEARRRCTWKIFQSIEYAGEQDQLKLSNFFSDMLTQVNDSDQSSGKILFGDRVNDEGPLSYPDRSSSRSDTSILDHITDPQDINVESSYTGPHMKVPFSLLQIRALMDHFKANKLLHVKYVLVILREARDKFKTVPNICKATTNISKQMTICGDLHGKMEDLFMIFHKNGLPSAENPYVFNGDLVDRGPYSLEIVLILFAFFVLCPSCIYINRGNHEDHIMNVRYGFVKEVMDKYKDGATKVLKLMEDICGWLPLATVIDRKILVCHGGISDITDLDFIEKIDRHKFTSVLKPPHIGAEKTKEQLVEWRQILDLLWSDPKPNDGCKPNTFRGGGCYFGPNITAAVLQKHGLDLLVRSHECKYEGYEHMHDDQVITVFSASNYYEQGSNMGAYMKITPGMKPYFVQYMTTKGKKHLTLKQRVSIVEESAIRELREKLYANRIALLEEFEKCDPDRTGYVTSVEWVTVIEDIVSLEIPWNMVKHQLVRVTSEGKVDYKTCLDQYRIENNFSKNGPSITETLYKNRTSLETLFRMMDKDNSGCVSMEEFEECCQLLSQHTNVCIPEESVQDIARSIDMNKDGFIDFNEFLEAFRLVDNPHTQRSSSPPSRQPSPFKKDDSEVCATSLELSFANGAPQSVSKQSLNEYTSL